MKLLFITFGALLGLARAQDAAMADGANATMGKNLTGPHMNKVDFAYAGAPLLRGDAC